MSAILALILPLLTKLPGAIGDYFKGKQEIEKIRQETNRQIALKTKELAAIIAKAEAEKATTLIKATSARFKYITFFIWFTPFILTLVFPEYGLVIFERLGLMPPWYAESVVYLMMVVWGAQISQPVVAGIFSGLKQFFREKRILKAATSEFVDNEALFTLIRSMTPDNRLSQEQVDSINEVIGNE